MQISARVRSSSVSHEAVVATADVEQAVSVPARASGAGSAVIGGEFLMLALATCYCNDIYREAARLQVVVEDVEVEASAEFPGVGLSATNVRYRARVSSPASATVIVDLLRQTDAVAEVQNTVRAGTRVELLAW